MEILNGVLLSDNYRSFYCGWEKGLEISGLKVQEEGLSK